MDPVTTAALASWHLDVWLIASAVLTVGVYLRGRRILREQMPSRFSRARAAAFVAGVVTLVIALLSPLDSFSGLILSAHMTQHLLLMMVAPPLLLIGEPGNALLRGLPAVIAREGVGPFIASRPLRRAGHTLTRPAVAWLLFVAATWLWHLPGPYERAVYSPLWHWIEHTCFFVTAILFWWPVIVPWPSKAAWPPAAMIAYLLLADIQNTALAAIFCFSERPLYPLYSLVPRLWDLPVLDDQVLAGVIMWVPGSIAFLVPVAVIVLRMLDGSARPRVRPSQFGSNTVFVLALGAALAPGAMADGGRVAVSDTDGPLRVTVFSTPDPLRTHDTDLSVMVQPTGDWRPLLDATVELTLRKIGTDAVVRALATREEAHNKLLYAAHLHLPQAGRWNLEAVARHDLGVARVDVTLEVAPTPWWMHGTSLAAMGFGAGLGLLAAARGSRRRRSRIRT